MFGLTQKAAPKLPRPVNTQVLGDTLRTSEQLARHYGLNPEALDLIQHAFGEAIICARINAKICDSATLRLYRRASKQEKIRHRSAVKQGKSLGFEGRALRDFADEKSGVRFVSTSVKAAMKKGRYGRKLAEFTLGGAEMVEVESHPALHLLSNPNWMYPGNEVNYYGWLFRWVVGNSYDHVSFQGDQPFQLNPLFAQHVNIVADDEKGIASYMYGRAESKCTPYSPDEVIHYKLLPSMRSPLYGECPLHDVLPYVDLLKDSLMLDLAMAKNGMRPDVMVRLPEGTTEKEQESFIKRMKNKFRGVQRWSEPLVVAGKDISVEQLMWPEKEAMTLPKREEAFKMIRRAYGHDEAQADSSDSTYAAALMGDSRFLGQHIEPALQQDAAQKSKLLRMFRLDPDEYAFAYDPLVEKDQKQLEDRIVVQVQSGLITPNEARVELGRERFDDPKADELQLAQAGSTDPFGGLFGSFGGSGGEQVETDTEPAPPGSGEEDEAAKTKKNFAKSQINSVLKDCEAAQWLECDCCKRTKDDDDDLQAYDAKLREAIRRFQGEVGSVAKDVIEDMQRESVEAVGAGRTPNLRPIVEQSAPMFAEVMEDIVKFGVTNILESGDLGGDIPDDAFNISQDRALRALDDYSFQLAGDLAETTVQMTERAVRVGVENGLSIDQIAKEMEGFPEYRAEAIARTETSRAMNTGAREGMIAVGVKKHKVLTAPGVRKSHAAIAAQGAIPIDQPFVKAGDTFGGETFSREISVPPFGVNCRCGVVAVFEGDDE